MKTQKIKICSVMKKIVNSDFCSSGKKRIKIGLRYITLGLVGVLLCFYMGAISVSAANEKVIASTTDDTGIYLYIKGVENITEKTVTVQIGNTVCENVSVESLDRFSKPMRTVILIDNSRSIKSDKRSDIQDILNQLVDQSVTGEEYRVGIFSNEITWLCDYSSDYELIKSNINSIQYENQNTYFSDCLYSVIEEMSNNADQTYSRVIIISDGADDQSIGYTIYEVSTLLEKSNIPVYTIGTPGNNTALENMFAFSRASKADYYQLDNSISNEDIVSGLLYDHSLICVHVIPDPNLLDGSKKNIQVTLNGAEGEIKLTASVDMPFVTNNIQEEKSDDISEQENVTPEASEKPSLPSLGGAAEDKNDDELNEEKSNIGVVLFLIIFAVLVLAAVVIVIVLLTKSRKKEKTISVTSSDINKQAPIIQPLPEEDDRTQMILENNTNDGDVTRILLGQPDNPGVFLVLKSIERPDIELKAPIQDVVRIGRRDADIVVDFDQHISTKQCEIIKRGELLYIKDLGSLNGTFYENIQVHDQEIPIVDGGTIKLGTSKFTVTMVKQ